MNQKNIIIIVIILAVAGGLYVYSRHEAKAPANNNTPQPGLQSQSTAEPSAPNTQTNVKGNTGADYTPPQSENAGETAAPNIQVSEVDFDGNAFIPSTVNIHVGDYVFFKNKSSVDFWPASSLGGYPGLNSLKAIAAGGEYKFQFTKAGTWNYQDNLNSTIKGVVIVSQ